MTASESSLVRARAAFSETSDPAGYVPREATERLLIELEQWANADELGSTAASILSPPGLGKTILLRLCEERLNARAPAGTAQALYVPYAGLELPELCTWVHGLLGLSVTVPGASDDPVAAIAALCALAVESYEPFYLLIDDADSMPLSTARLLANGLPREGSPLRVLMATGDDARATRLLASLSELRPLEVRLWSAMTVEETLDYLRQRLAWAGHAPAECERIDLEIAGRIHALSGGIPRRVHRVAEALFSEQGGDVPSDLGSKQAREDWMGRPLDDNS